MKVALVYDRLNKIGGAEQVLIAFQELFPDADWYTSVNNPVAASFAKGWRIHPSFLNYIPFLRNNHEFIPYLMPFAFESFNFNAYDLVISIGSAECKGIITRPETLHINYCLTPTRYLWSHFDSYLKNIPRLFLWCSKKIMDYMKKWDQVAAQRPDIMISISEHVKNRVKKYYFRESEVIYPPVDTRRFLSSEAASRLNNQVEKGSVYYLVVSRLVSYKNIDLIISAFNKSGKKLVIVGEGREKRKLMKMAKNNVTFVGQIDNDTLKEYFINCTAFIQANIEDFGIAMVEALAVGKPVIAYNEGGAAEIINGQTGVLYNEMSASSLLSAIDSFEKKKISKTACIKQAKKFDKELWKIQVKKRITEEWENHKKIYA